MDWCFGISYISYTQATCSCFYILFLLFRVWGPLNHDQRLYRKIHELLRIAMGVHEVSRSEIGAENGRLHSDGVKYGNDGYWSIDAFPRKSTHSVTHHPDDRPLSHLDGRCQGPKLLSITFQLTCIL